MTVDTRQRINLEERQETLLKWLEERGGGFHRNDRNKFEVSDTVRAFWQTLYPRARHTAQIVNAAVTRLEAKGLIKVERDQARTIVSIEDLRPKAPKPETMTSTPAEEQGSLVPVIAELLQELTTTITEMRATTMGSFVNLEKKIEAIQMREGQVAKILGDMSQQDTRRYDAILGKFEQLHGSLTGDRELRRDYSARIGLMERRLEALMTKAGIRLKD